MVQEKARLRLFVALLVPDEVKEKLHSSQLELREALASAAVSWSRPEQFHLTLKFLGSVDGAQLGALSESLKNACSLFPPAEIEAQGAGFFPNSKRPRVLWIGLRAPDEWIGNLQRAVETACGPFTSEKPEKRFHAHVTLGRVKQSGKHETDAMRSWAEKIDGHSFGAWRVREVALVRSQLSPKGATYLNVLLAATG